MLTDFTGADKIYIACGYTDLRRGIDSLAPWYRRPLIWIHSVIPCSCSAADAGIGSRRLLGRRRGWSLVGEALVCPNCGETMTEIGTEVVRTLEMLPARTVVKEHIYHTYACQKCSKEGTETPVVKAPRKKNIIPGSFATPEAVSYIMTQQFVMGSPIYRQEQELHRQGIPLSRATMSNWILKASQIYLQPVYEQLYRELLKRGSARR